MAKQNGHKATLDNVVEAVVGTNERLDRLIEIMGGHWRDLEKRVQRLEKKVG